MSNTPSEIQVFPINKVRAAFPALSRIHKNKSLVYLDGPAGSQVPKTVISAISRYYEQSNANSHGHFITSQETDQIIDQTREKIASFLGAEGPRTISFGSNMTTLNFALARSIGRYFQAGDEIIITQLDHEANRGPWLSLRENGIIVREIRLQENGTLDYDHFESLLNEKTRLVAIGYSSNILGTVNQLAKVRKMTYQYGAWMLVDAVHYAPHFSLDVQALGCDFLLCSAYKFYGPHVGFLYARPGLLDQLPTDRLRTQYQQAPHSIETGTFNHAALAGVCAAIDFIASLGEGKNLREQLVNAMNAIQIKEHQLAERLYEGLKKIKHLEIQGPSFYQKHRAPTISFLHKEKTASTVCQELADHGICAWNGHFYAIRAAEVMGLLELGGLTRMGISVYNTEEEIDRTLEVLEEI